MFKLLEDFIEDPIKTTIKTATQPISDACDVLEGLTEGELRERAALRLGVDIASGMALSEIINLLLEE